MPEMGNFFVFLFVGRNKLAGLMLNSFKKKICLGVKFIEKFQNNSKHRKLNLTEQNLGIECSKILSAIIQNNKHFTHLVIF